MPNTYNAADITEALMLFADKQQREILMKFFKTGKGEYGSRSCWLYCRSGYIGSKRAELRNEERSWCNFWCINWRSWLHDWHYKPVLLFFGKLCKAIQGIWMKCQLHGKTNGKFFISYHLITPWQYAQVWRELFPARAITSWNFVRDYVGCIGWFRQINFGNITIIIVVRGLWFRLLLFSFLHTGSSL